MQTAQRSAQTLASRGGAPACSKPVPFMSLALTREDKDAAIAVLDSGMLRSGPKCAELEQRFGEATGAKFAHTAANGTCALQLAYLALLEPGDEVLVPAWTYIATASMLVACGMKPVWVDSLPGTFQIDVADAARRMNPRVKGIAATHLYGMPVDVDGVQALAGQHGLKVVYDCAQAHLATSNGRPLGQFGDAVTYSFYATKNLGTGEGGMITVNDEALSAKIQKLRSHGEGEKYHHDSIGFNYRMNDITAAIGCSRLDRLAAQTSRRREIAALYRELLGEVEGVLAPEDTPGADSAWHLFTVKLDDGFNCTRDEFCNELKAEGVPTAVHYPMSLTQQKAFAGHVPADIREHPQVAMDLATRVFCLPLHHDLSDGQIREVCAAVAKVAGAMRG